MSLQAYLDTIEAKTGRTPSDFVAMAEERGYAPYVNAETVVAWLKYDFGLGRGHAMALVHVIERYSQVSDQHVGSEGVHRDESTMLRLDAKDS